MLYFQKIGHKVVQRLPEVKGSLAKHVKDV